MILKKLRMENIRSYESLEIEFPKGSVLLSGDIGSGKTSILLALQFALFGLQPGQKGASLLRQGEDKANVYLEFEVDGKKVVVERTLKKGKNNSMSQEKNILIIDGEREEISTSEIKERIVKLLDYPKEFAKKSNLLYKFTVYTPQEEMKAIIQERPEVRLDTLRHVFGIDRYKRIKENAQIFLSRIKEKVKIKEAEIGEINLLKQRLKEETEHKIKIAKETNNLDLEFKSIETTKAEAEKEVKDIRALIEEKTRLDSELLNKDVGLRGKKELKMRLEKEITSMKLQTQEKPDFSPERLQEVTLLLGKHRQLLEQASEKLMAVNSKVSVFESKKEQSLDIKNKIVSLENCPTCLQTVGEEHKDRLSKKTQFDIDDVNQGLEPALAEKKQTLIDIEKEKQLIMGYESDKNLLEQNKIKFEHQKTIEIKIKSDNIILERTFKEIEDIDKEIVVLKEKSESFKQVEERFKEKQTAFEEISRKQRLIEINLAEKNKELELLKIQLENLQKDIVMKEQVKEQINHLRELQDWLEEKFLSLVTLTETNVMAQLRSEFSRTFNEWFSILVSDSLSVKLDEDFTPVIINKDYEIDYDFLSGGERTAVALAYRLALNQVLNSLLSKIKTKDLVILDEPTDGFSEQQLDKMRDIFEQLKSEQMILVSHEQKIEGFVDNIIRIKKDGTSSIESS
jgi:DNA repair protein SbcC/Rad50